MKTLILIRHAKAGPAAPDDHDRPLTARGAADARKLGAWLAERGVAPELMLCSTARRARETCTELSSALAPRVIEFRRSLYLATPEALLAEMRGAPDEIAAAALIGHNDGLRNFAARLRKPADADARPIGPFPPAAVAILAFAIDRWRDLSPGAGVVRMIATPADFA